MSGRGWWISARIAHRGREIRIAAEVGRCWRLRRSWQGWGRSRFWDSGGSELVLDQNGFRRRWKGPSTGPPASAAKPAKQRGTFQVERLGRIGWILGDVWMVSQGVSGAGPTQCRRTPCRDFPAAGRTTGRGSCRALSREQGNAHPGPELAGRKGRDRSGRPRRGGAGFCRSPGAGAGRPGAGIPFVDPAQARGPPAGLPGLSQRTCRVLHPAPSFRRDRGCIDGWGWGRHDPALREYLLAGCWLPALTAAGLSSRSGPESAATGCGAIRMGGTVSPSQRSLLS